jgi:hypothetical protein
MNREPRFPYDPSFIGTPDCIPGGVNMPSHLFSQRIFSKKVCTKKSDTHCLYRILSQEFLVHPSL